MIGNLATTTLQQLWWIICSLVGSIFIFLTFVQGGQTLIVSAANETEKTLIINALGRKWELTFTTLVLFGGALFAAFPLFYATSFGGAYWVWILILLTFVIQAVSYEYRNKPDNLLGAGTYELFLFINGCLGVFLIGVAVGTFFTGANFLLNDYNQVTWTHSWRGVEALLNPFNVALGFFLLFLARVLGALYLVNIIDEQQLIAKFGRTAQLNFLLSLPFLLFVLIDLAMMDGYTIDPQTSAFLLVPGKYLDNLLEMPLVSALMVIGLAGVIWGVVQAAFRGKRNGIWLAGAGSVMTALALLLIAGLNNTPFYPSLARVSDSLTIYSASSSHYTLTAMTYVALAVPFVLGYISYVWWLMDRRGLTVAELEQDRSGDLY